MESALPGSKHFLGSLLLLIKSNRQEKHHGFRNKIEGEAALEVDCAFLSHEIMVLEWCEECVASVAWITAKPLG